MLVLGGPGIEAQGGTLVPRAPGLSVLPGIGLAMIGVLWAYEGWQYATFSAGETIDPQRTFPLGIASGTAAIILLYCLANVAYASALSPAAIMDTGSVASTAVAVVFGPAAGRLIAVAILISIFSAANAIVLTSTRVFFAMARDGVFFRALGRVDPRFGTPALSIAATCAWAMVLAASGTFDQLLTYVVFTGWMFYALGAASIFVLRRRLPDEPRPFRVPGYPVTPALFVLAACAIVVNALIGQPGRAFIGIGIVLIGAPAYFYWRSRAALPADVSPRV
jgi:APA family basic amino acid/polyamine antiporter